MPEHSMDTPEDVVGFSFNSINGKAESVVRDTVELESHFKR